MSQNGIYQLIDREWRLIQPTLLCSMCDEYIPTKQFNAKERASPEAICKRCSERKPRAPSA